MVKNNSENQLMCDKAAQILEIEAEAIENLIPRLDISFVRAVQIMSACEGRVVVTGMGKSGSVGRKISATLASTGTPAFFMHPAEGVHGDLGMVRKEDVVLAISYSGQTDEVKSILHPLQRIGSKIIAMTGDKNSILARSADVVLDISVHREAGPLALAPTASTTATLALGDALAMVLLDEQDFEEEDFALFHPGGSLGRQLLLKVDDLMHSGARIPLVDIDTSLKEAVYEMTNKRLGITAVVDRKGHLIGCLTDGDLRRILESKESDFFSQPLGEVMTEDPITIDRDMRAVHALQIMEKHQITVLFIVDEEHKPVGVIHMHDILRAGIN
ncbi:MAG: SIS domain-containing protein [bacterium]